MSRSLTLLLAGLVSLCGAVHAQPQATLTLFPEVAEWDEKIEARIEGIGCSGEVTDTFVDFIPGFGWTIDIDLAIAQCPISAVLPFSTTVEIGPLSPQDYIVYLRDNTRHLLSPAPAPLDTAALSVRREDSLEIVLPEAASDAAPFPIVFRGPASSSCFILNPPVVTGNVIEASFDDNCPILPPGGPHVFEEELQVGPLPAGEYEVRFFDLNVPQGAQPYLERKTLIVHEATGCVPSDTALCLQGGRFRIEVDWKDFQGNAGKGHAIPLAQRHDSGLFWYFQEENIELTVKVLDGCNLGGHWWVFLSSGSTVEHTVTVTDTETGRKNTYKNGFGEAAPLISDTSAFSCNP
ncbi:MAG TPA: hypothetical protein VF179_28345 [Thermoanaerobaculia bacterium]|nr:hypothetical protein [Thermoanaerobaculia bacterium]